MAMNLYQQTEDLLCQLQFSKLNAGELTVEQALDRLNIIQETFDSINNGYSDVLHDVYKSIVTNQPYIYYE